MVEPLKRYEIVNTEFFVNCLSLRELEKQIGRDLDSQLDPMGKNMTVNELLERYLKTRT